LTTISRAEFVPVATSIADYLLKRINLIHAEREIGAFAGPPGIGKTTVAQLVKREFGDDVVLVTPLQVRAKTIHGISYALAAIRQIADEKHAFEPTSRRHIETALSSAIKRWAWMRYKAHGEVAPPHLTLIFDEAQKFDEGFFEAIRSWNDPAWSDQLPPIGLIFMGNADFILESGVRGASFLSEAVLSRTAYSKTFEYADVKDTDIALVLRENGVTEAHAVETILEFCSLEKRNRDLRVVLRLVRDARREASGAEISSAHVYSVLGLEFDEARGLAGRRSRRKRAA